MDIYIENTLGQKKTPATQPAMTAKSLDMVKKSKEIITSSEANAKKETASKTDVETQKDDLSTSEPEEHHSLDIEA
jgi:hypothetical protein